MEQLHKLHGPPSRHVQAGPDREERKLIFERQKRDWPGFVEYEEKTKGIRDIPVVVLET